jgi:gluconate 2-dehydrogenase gamma chain
VDIPQSDRLSQNSFRVSSVSSGLCRPQNEDLLVSNESHTNSRRNFLKSGLIAISTAALPATTVAAGAAPTPSPNPQPTRFLNEPERHFLESAVDRLIPADGKWPGATEAGVVNYIDLQMGGAWGKGDLIYRHGPFRKGSWTQGYQLEYTPAELFRRSIGAINASFSSQGTTFTQLSPTEKDAYLAKLERGDFDLDGVPSDVFFNFLWKHTQEGFFADPMYGGNKDKVAWKMLGFPGAYTDFYELVDKHGLEFHRDPVGIKDGGMHMHSMANSRKD